MAVQAPLAEVKIIHPESAGQSMAENTKQFRWIVTVKAGLEALFAEDPAVFVAGDLLWYPQANSCSPLVEVHGGRIELENEAGRGTLPMCIAGGGQVLISDLSCAIMNSVFRTYGSLIHPKRLVSSRSRAFRRVLALLGVFACRDRLEPRLQQIRLGISAVRNPG